MKRLLIVCLLLLLLIPLTASETEGEAEGHHHFDWLGFLGKTFNALVLFGGLYLILRKPLSGQLSQTSIDIRRDIEERERAIAENEASMETLQKRIEQLESEIATIRDAAAAAGREQMQKLEDLGREETGRILARTGTEIDLRVESAVRQLKKRVADLTIENFSREFREKADAEVQRRLIDRGIDQIEGIDARE